MDDLKIQYATQFTRYPGGRFRVHGDWSGEAFREDTLAEALKKHSHITVDMDNCFTIPPSFLDEAFGYFVEKLGPDEFKKRFTVILTDDPDSMREWIDIQEKRSLGYKKSSRK